MWKILACLCGGLLWCAAGHAEVYKWVDENGKVQFSDKAPPAKQAEDISGKLEKTNVDHASSQSAVAVPRSTEKTVDEKLLEERKKQEFEAAMGDTCRKMKEDIDSIARGDRGIFRDKDGNEELVLERDRGKKLEEWKSSYRRMGCTRLIPLE